MRAAILHSYGPPENLVVEDVPDPTPKPHQLLVDVHACGVNFPDVLMVQDLYQFKPALPFAPGGEISGTVSARRVRRHRLGGRRPRRRRHRDGRLRREGRRRRGEGVPHPGRRRPHGGGRVPDDVRHVVPRPQGPGEPAARRDAARARRGRRRRPVGGRARGVDGRQGDRRRVDRREARRVPPRSAPARPSTTPTSTSRRGSRSTPAARASTSSTTRSAATSPSRRCAARRWKGRYLVIGFAGGADPAASR